MPRPRAGRFLAGGLPALLLACLLPAASAGQEDLLREGLELLHNGRPRAALARFSQFKQNSPEDPRGYHLSGVALAADGRYREAASEFGAAVERDPGRIEYRVAAAAALAEIGQLESALKLLQPYDGDRLSVQDDPLLLWLLADLHYRRQQNDDALRVLKRYAETHPEDPRTDIRIGRIHLLEGRFESALEAFSKAVANNPNSAAAHQGLGLAQAGLGKSEEALGSLRRAVEAEPGVSTYLVELGKALLERGDVGEAIQTLEQAESLPEPPPELFYELSRAHRRAGDAERARSYLVKFQELDRRRQADRVNAKRLEGLLKTAQDRLSEGQVKEARDAFAEALSLDPDNWAAHSFLAKIYLSSDRLPEAAEHLAELRRLNPESAEANFLTATYWYRTRRLDKALESAMAAKQIRSDYAELRNLLGNIHFSMGRLKEAESEYAAAVRLQPDREEFRRNLEAVRQAGN